MAEQMQIPKALFLNLCRLLLLEDPDPNLRQRCLDGLESKLDAAARRELYTRSKTAATEEEREEALKQYVEKSRNVSGSFRWNLDGKTS